MVERRTNLVGRVFGRLKVVSYSHNDVYRHAVWNCMCDCGEEAKILGYRLTSGRTRSCGCLHRETIIETQRLDLTGEKFGRLTVVSLNKAKNRRVYWNCRCDCGNETIVQTSSLRLGNTVSCGCYKNELASLRCGENSPAWKGGVSGDRYCYVWNDEDFKQSIKERDGGKCMNPSCWKNNDGLCIHHIDYNKKNCNPWNLITLCRSCNSKANFCRQSWERLYKRVIYYTYDYIGDYLI